MKFKNPIQKSNAIAIGIVVFSIFSFVAYLGTEANKRVGYKNPKIEMGYAAQANDIPNYEIGLQVVGEERDCIRQMPLGAPDFGEKLPEDAAMVCHKGYATIFSLKTKTPVAVSHVLSRSDFIKANMVERQNNFTDDPLANGKNFPKSNDYRGTNYDRGHLAPNGDFAYNQELANESFYMTNIAPQSPQHNRGIWARLEMDIRKLLKRGQVCIPIADKESFDKLDNQDKCRGDAIFPYQRKLKFEQLYITTGTLYHHDPKSQNNIGDNNGTLGSFRSGVKIPNYFYKVVFEPYSGMSAAYLIPNLPQYGNANYHQFHIPLQDLERKYLKYKLFSSLDSKKIKFKNFYFKVDDKTKQAEPTGGRNGMLDKYLF